MCRSSLTEDELTAEDKRRGAVDQCPECGTLYGRDGRSITGETVSTPSVRPRPHNRVARSRRIQNQRSDGPYFP